MRQRGVVGTLVGTADQLCLTRINLYTWVICL